MHKIVQVEVLQGYHLALTFNDGVKGVVDLGHLAGRGVFSSWNERREFEQVQIGTGGELLWGKEADLCPDALYYKVTGATPLSAEAKHA